jgi:hypothetical protein
MIVEKYREFMGPIADATSKTNVKIGFGFGLS